MSEKPSIHNSQQLARFILTTDRRIRGRVFQICSEHLASCQQGYVFGELSLPQFTALMIVQEQGALSMNELAGYLMVSPPSASAMVDRLVGKGLLTRTPGVIDRRQVIVSISPESAQKVTEMEGTVLQMFSGFVDKIGKDTAKKWGEILNRVKQVLESG